MELLVVDAEVVRDLVHDGDPHLLDQLLGPTRTCAAAGRGRRRSGRAAGRCSCCPRSVSGTPTYRPRRSGSSAGGSGSTSTTTLSIRPRQLGRDPVERLGDQPLELLVADLHGAHPTRSPAGARRGRERSRSRAGCGSAAVRRRARSAGRGSARAASGARPRPPSARARRRGSSAGRRRRRRGRGRSRGRRRRPAGSSKTSGSRLAPASRVVTTSPRRTGTPETTVSAVHKRPVSSTGGSTRRTSSTALGHSEGSSRSRSSWSGCCLSRAMPLPSRFTVVSKPAASTSPAVALSSRVVEPDTLFLDAHELAHQVVAGLAPQVVQVGVEPGVEVLQATLHAAELGVPQAEVEARRGGVAELEHASTVLGRDAEDLRDHGDRQLAAVRRDQVDGPGRVEGVEQLVGDLLRAGAQVLDGAGREDPGHQLAVAGVVRRFADQQRRRHERTEQVGVLGPHADAAQDPLAGLEDAGPEVAAGEHLLDRGERWP